MEAGNKTCDGGCVAEMPVACDGINMAEVPAGEIGETIASKLKKFDQAITDSGILAIRAYIPSVEECSGEREQIALLDPKLSLMLKPEDSGFKVDNDTLKASYLVPVKVILKTPLRHLILSLESGTFERLQGVTRIVGYYSRVRNWNKSKIGELRDRQSGKEHYANI